MIRNQHCRQTVLLVVALLVAPTVLAQDCYSNLTVVYEEISDDSRLLEQKVFVLCPNTTFDLGFLEPGVGVRNGQNPIVPRSNTEFLCGENGSSTNNCTLKGGDFGVIGASVFFQQDSAATNVLIKGIQFESQLQYGAFMAMAGDVTFQDCIFRNQENFGPVLLTYEAQALAGNETQLDGLEVTFKQCLFEDNAQVERQLGVEFGILTVKGMDNLATIDDCIFLNNNYGDSTLTPIGYAILVSGGQLILKNSCFIENDFLGYAPVVLEDADFFVLIGNYADDTDDSLDCNFLARFASEEDRELLNFHCIQRQSDNCKAEIPEGVM